MMSLQLDRFFSIWNNALHGMIFWVHTADAYRTRILGRVYAAFFNYHYFSEINNIPDEIVLASNMTALDLEFERALHYHNKGYDSDNDYGLPGPVMRPVCIYLASTTEASFNPADYKGTQFLTSPFTPRQPHWKLTQTIKQRISPQLALMTWYGLKSLYPIANNNCASTRYHAILPDQ